MSNSVEIALVGNKEHAFTAGAVTWQEDGQTPQFLTPWERRERVVLEVEPTDTLDELPAPDVPAFGFCAFYVDDAPGGPG